MLYTTVGTVIQRRFFSTNHKDIGNVTVPAKGLPTSNWWSIMVGASLWRLWLGFVIFWVLTSLLEFWMDPQVIDLCFPPGNCANAIKDLFLPLGTWSSTTLIYYQYFFLSIQIGGNLLFLGIMLYRLYNYVASLYQ